MIENAVQILKEKIADAHVWEDELEFKRDTVIKEAGTINRIIKSYENELGDYLFIVAEKQGC